MILNPHAREIQMKKFVKAYIENGGNATQAALATKKLSYNSARQVGTDMLKRPDVIEEIKTSLADLGLNYSYVLSARKKFVEKGLKQLNGEKKENEPFVSPSDTSKHLQGIETILERTEAQKGNNLPNALHIHLDMQSKSHKEIIEKHKELAEYFSSVIDGELIESDDPLDPTSNSIPDEE